MLCLFTSGHPSYELQPPVGTGHIGVSTVDRDQVPNARLACLSNALVHHTEVTIVQAGFFTSARAVPA